MCFFESDAFRSLFLYAAINNMLDMAVMFWGYGRDATMKALVVQLIFRKMYIRAKTKKLSDGLIEELRNNER